MIVPINTGFLGFKIIFLLILGMSTIVFAHFRTKIPKHLIWNLRRTSLIFPSSEIVLLTDQINIKGIPTNVRIIAQTEIFGAKLLQLSTTHPMSFRNGFWFTTLLRLLAVCEFVIASNVPIIHVESDVLISPDFPLGDFANLAKPIAYPLVSQRCGVASTLYIRDGDAALSVRDSILEMSKNNSKLTDMIFLRQFYDLNTSKVSALPSGPMQSIVLQRGLSENYKQDLKQTFGILNGYFDTVDLGFYLTGEDPRNHRGRRRLRTIDPESDIWVRRLKFHWDNDREFISISAVGSKEVYPLFSLHIHSKDLKVFRIRTFGKRLQKRLRFQLDPPKTELVLEVFMSQLVRSIRRRLSLIILRGN